MSDEYSPIQGTVRARQWLPDNPQAVIDMLNFAMPICSVLGIVATHGDEVALDIEELDQWVSPTDWLVLRGGTIERLADSEFSRTYRLVRSAHA